MMASGGERIVRFRSDSAAHQIEIMTYCDMDEIECYISLDKNAAVMKSVEEVKQWKKMEGGYAKNIDKRWEQSNKAIKRLSQG